jgi:outer membrane protein
MFVIFLFQYVALGANPTKIGVVDMQRFQASSRAFQKTTAVLKKKFDDMQSKLDREQNELRKLEEEFKKQSMMLSLDAKEDKKRALEKKRRYYKYLYEDFSQEMKNDEVEATKKIGQELEKVVKRIGEKEGYLVILDKRTLGLLYYDRAIDITEQVIKAYDQMKR